MKEKKVAKKFIVKKQEPEKVDDPYDVDMELDDLEEPGELMVRPSTRNLDLQRQLSKSKSVVQKQEEKKQQEDKKKEEKKKSYPVTKKYSFQKDSILGRLGSLNPTFEAHCGFSRQFYRLWEENKLVVDVEEVREVHPFVLLIPESLQQPVSNSKPHYQLTL